MRLLTYKRQYITNYCSKSREFLWDIISSRIHIGRSCTPGIYSNNSESYTFVNSKHDKKNTEHYDHHRKSSVRYSLGDESITHYAFSNDTPTVNKNVQEQLRLISEHSRRTSCFLEVFLSHYNAMHTGNFQRIEGADSDVKKERRNTQGTEPMLPCGKELDSMFGLHSGDVITESRNVNHHLQRDNYFHVTDLLESTKKLKAACETVEIVARSLQSMNTAEVYNCVHRPPSTATALNSWNFSPAQDTNVESTHNVLKDVVSGERQVQNSQNGKCSSNLYFSVGKTNAKDDVLEGSSSDQQKDNLPNRDQLMALRDYLVDLLPKVISKPQKDWNLFTSDVVLENNWAENPYVTQGLHPYIMEYIKLRAKLNLHYNNIKVTALKSTILEEDGAIKIRWRMSGLPQSTMLKFWKFLPWNYKENIDRQSIWHDGLSTLYVDKVGQIYKHQVDKVTPDDEFAVDPVEKQDTKSKLVEKIKEKIPIPTPTPV